MWYYADAGRQAGPVSDEELRRLVGQGAVGGKTMVWREGMPEWRELGTLYAASDPETAFCSVCGRYHPPTDMIRFGEAWVCAACKPAFVQGLREGLPMPGVMAYGGFWIRAAAKFIDGVILTAAQMVVNIPLFIMMTPSDSKALPIVATVLMYVFQIGIGAAYNTILVGRYGATVGKMACQLRVVMSDGGKVSYWRALGRHFSELLSWMILGIGYIMAAFDDEKRTLHDRICDTRVVRK